MGKIVSNFGKGIPKYCMALKFCGSKFLRIALPEHIIENFSWSKCLTHTNYGRGVLQLKIPGRVRAELNYHFVGAATLFPTSMLSAFVFRYLGVPLTFAGSRQISHMMVPLGRALHVDPEAYTSTTVHPHC